MEDWNARYAAGDIPWDQGEPAPALTSLYEEGIFPVNASILVPGCGRGHDVAALARQGYKALGLDISDLAIAAAEQSYSTISGAHFLSGDVFDPEWSNGEKFDAIWEHTCYCALHPSKRDAYVKAMHRLLKQQGLFIGLFFTDTQMPEGQGPPFETSRDEVVEIFSPLFSLTSERPPPTSYPDRKEREWLMIWQAR